MTKNQGLLHELYEKYATDVYRFIYSRCGRREDSEDILCDTFIALNDVLESYNGASTYKTFIIGIALNKIRQYWQKNSLKTLSLSDEDTEEFEQALAYEPDDLLTAQEQKDQKSTYDEEVVKDLLANLPENHRNVIICRFLERLTIKETATKLNMSETNVTSLQNRAIEKARKLVIDLNLAY